MIFVTVGTQMPFDRLIGYIDTWSNPYKTKVFCQIGCGQPPVHHAWVKFLTDTEFYNHAQSAQLIVSHAGIGTLITASRYRKRIILVPRLSELKEHRNNHQLATARAFKNRNWIDVVDSERVLHSELNKYTSPDYRETIDFEDDDPSHAFANKLARLI